MYTVKNVMKFNVLLSYTNQIQFYDTKLNLMYLQLKSKFVYMCMKFIFFFFVFFIQFYEVIHFLLNFI